ncbi:hypothetical protein [Dictyobacter arantiisoli]|uniref:Uncharacterized protein n=1 Tax=Dictyobacter arantiisoli TaxID=2014874 RepID=A0A5A5TDM9_9CHLR|nr:hypothetical protein [Dictyobacter arantiisoli]GCF09153.1 hypothetical protein KDI_27170 [Dictyobacter arantiisoli]
MVKIAPWMSFLLLSEYGKDRYATEITLARYGMLQKKFLMLPFILSGIMARIERQVGGSGTMECKMFMESRKRLLDELQSTDWLAIAVK